MAVVVVEVVVVLVEAEFPQTHGRRMSYSRLCMCVFSRGYGETGGGRDGGGGWFSCGITSGGWSYVTRYRSTSRVRGDTLMMQNPPPSRYEAV